MESVKAKETWEAPVLTVLGDLDAVTAAGISGSEDGPGFAS